MEDNLLAILETRPARSGVRSARVSAPSRIRAGSAGRGHGLDPFGRRAAPPGDRPGAGPGPRFLLLDEPFTGIDPLVIQDLQGIIRSLQAQGLGILITDHAVRETLRISDRAAIIDKGTVLKEGTPAEIVASESVRQSYLGDEFRL